MSYNIEKTDLAIYKPRIYDGVRQTDTIVDVENVLFNKALTQLTTLENNQFIQYASINMIKRWESILNIIPNEETDSLEFRRARVINRIGMSPPFTMVFLRQKLDEILGVGTYKIHKYDGAPPEELIKNDFSDFIAYQGATVMINKTFPIDVFRGAKNLYVKDSSYWEVSDWGNMYIDLGNNLAVASFSDNDLSVELKDLDLSFCDYLTSDSGNANSILVNDKVGDNLTNVIEVDGKPLMLRYLKFNARYISSFEKVAERFNIKVEIGTTPTEYCPAPEDGYDYQGIDGAYHIQTSGGSHILKLINNIGRSVVGIIYKTEVDLLPWSNLKVSDNIKPLMDVTKNEISNVSIQSEGNGTTQLSFIFTSNNTSTDLDFIASNPSIIKNPRDEGWEYVDPFEIIVESAVSNLEWYGELGVTINKIKPANMVYRLRPLIQETMLANETIEYSSLVWNYGLGTTWRMGEKPFQSLTSRGVVKVPTTNSMTVHMLKAMANTMRNDINHALINDKKIVAISKDNMKVIQNGDNISLEIKFDVENLGEPITNIKLRKESTDYTSSQVYIPTEASVQIKHIIPFKEGI